jgi:hypothetical protein
MTDAARPYERRAHRRFHVRGTAILDYEGAYQSAPIKDISLGGVRVAPEAPLPAGAVVPVDILLLEGGVVVATAEVVRSDDSGTGLRFRWPGEGDQSRLLLQEALGG